jgi:soluble lytic murein transglycosylase
MHGDYSTSLPLAPAQRSGILLIHYMARKKRNPLWLIIGILIPPLLVAVAAWCWGSFEKEQNKQFDSLIAYASWKYELDPQIIRAVIWRESDFDPLALGLVGERGLMQVTPVAAGEWAKAENIENFNPVDLFDPRTCISAGSWYLSRAASRWQHTDRPIVFALAEYNAGRTHARRWAENLPTPSAALFIDQIDFPTTKKYILDILDRYHDYQENADPSVWQIVQSKASGLWWRWLERRQIREIKKQAAQAEP